MAGPFEEGGKADALLQQDAALAPTPVAQAPGLASTGQQMTTGVPRARYGGRMNPDGGLAWNASNDQMMPGGTQIQESRSTQVGKYGGSPLFGNTGQILPHAHWANQLQGNRLAREKQRAEIRQKLEKWDPMGGIPEVAPAYQESLDNYVAAGFEDVYKAALDLNGGDEQQAQLAMMNPGSPEGRALADFRNAATVVARKANFVTNDALAAMKAMDEGEAEYNQEVYDAADAAIRALNNGGNVRAVADSLEQYQTVKEWNSFIKENGIADQLLRTDWSKETLNIPKGRDRNGMLVYETIGAGDPRMKDAIIQQTMLSIPPKYHKLYGEDGLYQRLERLLSANITSDAKVIDPYHAPTGESSKPKSGYNFGNIGVSAGLTPASAGTQEVFGVPTAGGGTLGSALDPTYGKVPTLALTETTGDKTKEIGIRRFNDPKGEPHQLYGASLKKIGNEWVVIGRELSAKEIEKISNEVRSNTSSSGRVDGVTSQDIEDEITKRVQEQSLGALRTYKAMDNVPEIEGYIGTSDLDGLWNSLQGRKTTSVNLDSGQQSVSGGKKTYKYNPATGQLE